MKSSVVPVRDDESKACFQNKTKQLIQGSRGVSFSTRRGKIWLLLVVNLSIITMFIFVSSSCFPSMSGNVLVNNAQEQAEQHVDSTNANYKQGVSIVTSYITKESKERQKYDVSHSRGYTKLISTEDPDAIDIKPVLTDARDGPGVRINEDSALLVGSEGKRLDVPVSQPTEENTLENVENDPLLDLMFNKSSTSQQASADIIA